ncbi:MAG: hypothetical protein M1816_005013 [Peltula sp. TS41687]|nr:MAG: hypothetical protein M1816_005013 [Peltula sp. TS41687]
MCEYELLHYAACGHHEFRFLRYCHQARMDPDHLCLGVRTVKRQFTIPSLCEGCEEAEERRKG